MTKDFPTRLLLVEDNPGDARLIMEMLSEQSSHRTETTHVGSMSEAERHLGERATDIILLDLGLPDGQGLAAVRWAHTAAPHVPMVVLTGLDDESVATQALQVGAQDYLIKGQIDTRGLLRALRYAVERKIMEEASQRLALQMAHSAQHDVLTGLPNRTLLNERVSQAISLAPRRMSQVAVMFLDVDGFKHINDSMGHPTGDKLLQSIARRLVACVRPSDAVSRQGGDEFVVLLSEAEQWESAAIVATRMLQAVAEAHIVDEQDLHVTASIGISVFPDDGVDAETLIKNADTAMYQAKENGRHRYQFFEPAMNVRAVERQSIEASLRRALERQELSLHYQPKIDLKTGAIKGVEALLRWTHPDRGPVAPAQFIPIAEDCGLILPIGRWVLREACRQAQAWVDAGLPAATMAVNASAIEFRDEDFLEELFAIVTESGLDPTFLELELTEGVLMKHAESAASILKALRAKGVQVAVDDFGTGYSSLSYLRRFPIDALKIDRSFISQITAVGDDTRIVTAVISMARSLNLRVVAEGVETPEQLDYLRSHECDEAQGYYFSRPVPAHAVAELLRTGIPPPSVAQA